MSTSRAMRWSQRVVFLAAVVFICGFAPAISAAEHTVAPVGAEFVSIQAALDFASDGDTVTVESGTYEESVRLDKTISLIGIDSGGGSPVIDTLNKGNGVEILANGCAVEGFVIRNSELLSGIRVSSSGNIIRKNIVLDNAQGILIVSAQKNSISSNNITGNSRFGITLQNSGDNVIQDNDLEKNTVGIALDEFSGTNLIFRNNFINPQNIVSKSETTVWDSPTALAYTYLGKKNQGRMGNYWSDYAGRTDKNGDGIGDSVYQILLTGSKRTFVDGGSDVVDAFPLMDPKEFYSAIVSAPDPSVTKQPTGSSVVTTASIAPVKTTVRTTPIRVVTTTPLQTPTADTGNAGDPPFSPIAIVLAVVILVGISGAIFILWYQKGSGRSEVSGEDVGSLPASEEPISKSLLTSVPEITNSPSAFTGAYTSAAEQKNYFPRELENQIYRNRVRGTRGDCLGFFSKTQNRRPESCCQDPHQFR